MIAVRSYATRFAHAFETNVRPFIKKGIDVAASHPVAAGLLLGLVLRGVWIIHAQTVPINDYKWYYERAIDIAQGKGYTVEGIPTAYWPVGYPAFLSIFFYLLGPSLHLASALNVLLSVGVLWLSYDIAKHVFESRRIGMLTLLGLTVYPSQVFYCSLVSSEVLFLFLIMLGVRILISEARFPTKQLIAGVVFGIAVLVKPIAVLAPLFCFIQRSPGQQKNGGTVFVFKRIAVSYAGVFLLVAPWLLRNYELFGDPFISTNGGINFLIGNNPDANGRYFWSSKVGELIGSDGAADVVNSITNPRIEVIRDRKALQYGLNFVKQNPWAVLKMVPKRFAYLYNSDHDGLGLSPNSNRGTGMLSWGSQVYMQLADKYHVFVFTVFCFSVLYLFPRKWTIPGATFQFILLFVVTVMLIYVFGPRKIPLTLTLLLGGFTIINEVFLRRRPSLSGFQLFGLAIVAGLTGFYLLFFGQARFHFPLVPFMVMYDVAIVGSMLIPADQSHLRNANL